MIPQFDWLCEVRGCVMSPTSGIYWVDLSFINNYKEPQLWLVLLRYSANMASAFPWVVTYLRKRRVLVLNWCYMCKNCGESVDHLLLHCPIAWVVIIGVLFVWNSLGYASEGYWVVWVLAGQGKFGQHKNIELRRIVPHCLLWYIWHKRNAKSFEGCEQTMLEIKFLFFFFFTLLDWSVVFCHFSCSSLPALLDRCNLGYWFMPP